jgi:hypothetical protein
MSSPLPIFKGFTTFALRDPVSKQYVIYFNGGNFQFSKTPPLPQSLSIYYVLPSASAAIGILSGASPASRLFFANDGWSGFPPVSPPPALVTPVSTSDGSLALWTGSKYIGPPASNTGPLILSSTPIPWEYAPMNNAYWLNPSSTIIIGGAGGVGATALASAPYTASSSTTAAVPFEVTQVDFSAGNLSSMYIAAALGSLNTAQSSVSALCVSTASISSTTCTAQLQIIQLLAGLPPVAPSGMLVLTVTDQLLFQVPGVTGNWYVSAVNLQANTLTLTASAGGTLPPVPWLADNNYTRPSTAFLAPSLNAAKLPFPLPTTPPKPPQPSRHSSSGLSTGALIGIVAGVVVVVVLAIVLGTVYGRKRRRTTGSTRK